MTIKITLEFSTPAEAVAALQSLQSAAVNAEDDKYRSSLQAKREVAKAAKPKAEKVEKVAPAEQAVVETAEQSAPAVDYPTVQAAILKVANAKGREAALEILSGFGAKAGKELKPEQYEAALAAFNAELEG